MPVYHLEGSIVLLAGALISASVFFLQFRLREGAIQLPLHGSPRVDAEDDDGGSEPELEGEKDLFHVTTAQDTIDGNPLDEDLFWRNMKFRKVGLASVYALIFSICCIAFGYSLTVANAQTTVAFGLHTLFAGYLFGISILSIYQTEILYHWPTVIHLALLSSSTVVLMIVASIVPASSPSNGSINTSPTLLGLWYTSLALHSIAMIASVTAPRGPQLNFPSEDIYSLKTLSTTTNHDRANVCGIVDASPWSYILFSYTTKVVMLGNTAESLEIGDLPIVPADMRAATIFAQMRHNMKSVRLRGRWKPKEGSGWETLWRLWVVNRTALILQAVLAAVSAMLFYGPAYFLQLLVKFLESKPEDLSWGFVYCTGLFGVNAFMFLITGQLWSISTTVIQSRLKIQLNSTLFAKCLVRKDVASSSSAPSAAGSEAETTSNDGNSEVVKTEEADFSSKAQIMTLMTTDVDRVSDFSWHIFTLIDSPIEIIIGTCFLYKLLGVSCFVGLAFTCLFLPLNTWAGKVVVSAQEGLMKSRDERVALMNEVLGAIRMIKFMAWERSFEQRVMKLRTKELYYQRRNYIIECFFNILWQATPIIVTLVSFWHFSVVRGKTLTPSIAFTSITIFSELKFALNALPETFINMLQGFVSARRIERYLISPEIPPTPVLDDAQEPMIVLNSATISWPQTRFTGSTPSSVASTPKKKFMLVDLSLNFPVGKLSLICGRLGSGKSLLLLAMLGEADVLTGQMLVPRSPPDSIATFSKETISDDQWVRKGICAYVPQSAWLQNASIRDNILFNLPYNEARYQSTLEACALINDLEILEDGDQSEIGERGVNLSGGQKARVSLARAVYSRASILFLDDVLSAVDAHTADHLYHQCLLGPLMRGRTILLVSHHVQLCAPQAQYVVSLDNGRASYAGDYQGFVTSGSLSRSVQRPKDQAAAPPSPGERQKLIEENEALEDDGMKGSQIAATSSASSTVGGNSESETKGTNGKEAKRAPRKLIEEEKRAVGRIGKDIWITYLSACGKYPYWILFSAVFLLASGNLVLENGWLRVWSGSIDFDGRKHSPTFYIAIYTAINMAGLVFAGLRWFVLYYGGLHGSRILYERLLETILRAQIRFHDTVSRGRLLNRFGKDFEGIDSNLPDHFGRTIINGLSVATTVVTLTYACGFPFLIALLFIGYFYYTIARVYGQTSRDMRRLDSVTRSPLYSIYGETIAGVTIIRSFGAGSKFLRDMLRCVDTNLNPYYWMWGVNRWLSTRFNLMSSLVVGVTGLAVLITPGIDASLAGFALAFSTNITNDLLFMVRRFVSLEQAMVAVERVKEFSQLVTEPPEFLEPRPPSDWPHEGNITCEQLAIRYAPDLPNVLHNISFEVRTGEKIGILGRTGSGKSTLALSFFRFVEATEGHIIIDGLDISKIGITDLRSRLTIIPQDPTILSGSIRSTLDVFDEYTDAEIFEALRRVHLIPSASETEGIPEATEAMEINANVFESLDSPVSESGDNFSTGEKQLLCMARAILKRSKILVMDEATASVDYATDELIGKTIRSEFADSTILTIAHRLRTVIDYDKVMVLEDGRIAEFDSPTTLIKDPSSKFYSLCKATGAEEFETLCSMASGH